MKWKEKGRQKKITERKTEELEPARGWKRGKDSAKCAFRKSNVSTEPLQIS